MIKGHTIKNPIDLLSLHQKVELKEDYSDPLIIEKTNPNFCCPVITDSSDIGFRLAYFLWIMRGANKVEELDFYKDHLHHNTDDEETLRGAYGPRLRYWVGPDQIVEANRINMDIDEKEDMVKPKGTDQILKMFEDLKGGMGVTTSCVFNPSIDYDDSNDIPALTNISFTLKNGELNLFAHFTEVFINGQFVNDYFFLGMLQLCMAQWLHAEVGTMAVMICNPIYQPQDNVMVNKNHDLINSEQDNINFIDDKTFWADMMQLCGFERHMRMRIVVPSFFNVDVSIIQLSEGLIKNFIDKIKIKYFRNYAYALLVYAIMQKGTFVDEQLLDFVAEIIEGKMYGSLLYEICWWISMNSSTENKVTKLAEEVLKDG